MNRVLFSTVLALVAAVPFTALAASAPVSPVTGRGVYDAVGTNADYAIVDVGTQAPDFSFDAPGRSMRLRDLRAQGHVLVVFQPDDAHLVALERERARLLSIGVVPVAVLDQRSGGCEAVAHRLGLGFSVIPDPRRLIGAQFNALDPSSRADAPAWFVIDQRGRVRELAHLQWPKSEWTEVTARALGLPGPDAAAPASFGKH
jgi:peroxiredoxin